MPASHLQDTINFVSQAFSLTLPILIAGLCFIFILHKNIFSVLNTPLERSIYFRGKRLFGDNKTWRGIIAYLFFSVIVTAVLWASIDIHPTLIHPVFRTNPFALSLVFSFSYIFGELLNSFIKRRLGIAQGEQRGCLQKIVDDIDGMIIVAIALIVLLDVSPMSVLVAVTIGAVIHLGTDLMMKHLGLK